MKSFVSRRVWIALSTLIVVALFFAYYFLIYIPDNEQALVNEKFRVLQRIGKNFIEMRDDLENSIDIMVRDCKEKNKDAIDSVVREFQKNGDYTNLTAVASMQQKIMDLRACNNLNELKQLKVESDNFYTPLTSATRFVSHWTNNKQFVFLNSYEFKIKMSDFITNPSLLKNEFDRVIIFRTLKPNQSKRGTAVISYQGNGETEMSGGDNKIILSDINKLFETNQGLSTIPMRTFNISGVKSRIFSYVLEFNKNEDWVLCGIVKERDIQRQSRSIELSVILFLILILLFVLLAMPTLKLFVMNSIERLQVLNVGYTGVSVIIGTALLTILFLSGHHFIDYRQEYEEKLEALSDAIKSNYNREISAIVGQMRLQHQYSSLVLLRYGPTGGMRDFVPLYDPRPALIRQYYKPFDFTLINQAQTFKAYPFFNELMFLQQNGKVTLEFSTHELAGSSTLPDLNKRRYFTDSRDKNLTTLRDPVYTTPFAIQSIRSWSTGKNEAGVSISLDPTAPKDSTLAVVATATSLKSLMDPLLSPGYHFCVVDGQGNVLFHSDGRKNLQENFFDEIEHDNLARASVEGRLSQTVAITYSGKRHLAYFQPLDTRDAFLVTLLDMDYYNTPIVLTLGFVMILTTILLLLQGGQLFFLYCLTYTPTNLPLRRFFLNWLRPRGLIDHPESQHFRNSYARLIVAMALIAIVLLFVCYVSDSRYLGIAFLTLPALLFSSNYFLLYKADPENNSIRHRNIFILLGLCISVIITIGALVTMDRVGMPLIILQLLIVLILCVSLFTDLFSLLNITAYLKPFNLYITFLSLWLFLISVLPVFYFYKASFHHEYFLWSKFLQWEAFQKTTAREDKLGADFNEMQVVGPHDLQKKDSIKTAYFAEFDKYGCYLFADGSIIATKDKPKDVLDLKPSPIEKIEFRVRPRVFGPMENSRFTLLNGQNAAKWYAKASRDNIILNSEKRNIFYSSPVPSFQIFKGHYAMVFILVFVFCTWGIYQVLRFSIKYIFGWSRINFVSRNTFSLETLQSRLRAEINLPLRQCIVGLPFSGKSKFLQTIKEEFKAAEIFLRQGTGNAEEYVGKKLIILYNFEHAINDNAELTNSRINLIKSLLNSDSSIIISSSVQPELIIEIIENKIKRLVAEKKSEEKNKESLEQELADLRNSYRIWKNILGDFEIYYNPLRSTASDNFTDRELSIGNFLPRLKANFDDTITQEDAVLSIEEMAQGYYHALWNSFSRLEKHMLFDLAKDSFVNMRDLGKIRLLILKGVVVMEDAPRLMNKSFNNFILSVVKEDEELAMTNELRRKGSWSGIQIVLIIALVSITIFIALVQQEILSSVDALVATVSGVVALLMRFTGIFGSGQNKEAK